MASNVALPTPRGLTPLARSVSKLASFLVVREVRWRGAAWQAGAVAASRPQSSSRHGSGENIPNGACSPMVPGTKIIRIFVCREGSGVGGTGSEAGPTSSRVAAGAGRPEGPGAASTTGHCNAVIRILVVFSYDISGQVSFLTIQVLYKEIINLEFNF